MIKRFCITALFLLSLFVSPGGADIKPVEVKKDDKCPVCGMFVAKYRQWIAQVIFKDGTYAVFDGPKDMFRYYLNMEKHAKSKRRSDISAIFVTEYYSTKLMDATKLIFVSGSSIYGPMGEELIPVTDEQSAREFMKDHKGTAMVKFSEISEKHLK